MLDELSNVNELTHAAYVESLDGSAVGSRSLTLSTSPADAAEAALALLFVALDRPR